MNKERAHKEMLSGKRLTNKYLVDAKYLTCNKSTGKIEDDRRHVIGDFWEVYYPDLDWVEYKRVVNNKK